MKRLGLVFLLLTSALRADTADVLLAAATDAELQPLIKQLDTVVGLRVIDGTPGEAAALVGQFLEGWK